jgi:aminoglycoside/choline kinase family phosphotransferase
MDFMLAHFVRGLRRHSPPAAQEKELRRQLTDLCRTLASEPLVFAHRDYHSRNLMVHGEQLFMLDFQDARRGPCQYDLASLLRDSYVELEDPFVEEMVEYFLILKKSRDGRQTDRDRFYRIFDLMSVQRNLKAVGTFAFQSAVRGNPRYLQYLPRTLGYVAKTLARRPELRPLQNALAAAIPELSTTA